MSTPAQDLIKMERGHSGRKSSWNQKALHAPLTLRSTAMDNDLLPVPQPEGRNSCSWWVWGCGPSSMSDAQGRRIRNVHFSLECSVSLLQVLKFGFAAKQDLKMRLVHPCMYMHKVEKKVLLQKGGERALDTFELPSNEKRCKMEMLSHCKLEISRGSEEGELLSFPKQEFLKK